MSILTEIHVTIIKMRAKSLLYILVLLSSNMACLAKLVNSFDDNKKQYGEPAHLDVFPSKKGFSGFATYILDKDWKLKAFFIDDQVRSEHLIQNDSSKIFTRDQVRERALVMFDPVNRGAYRQQLTQPRIEGHFFDKGLIAYEYEIKGKKTVGYRSVRVLLYEKNQNFNKINPKAYL